MADLNIPQVEKKSQLNSVFLSVVLVNYSWIYVKKVNAVYEKNPEGSVETLL